MKTKIYKLVTAAVLLGTAGLHAETVKQTKQIIIKEYKGITHQNDSLNQAVSEKLRPEQTQSTLNHAMGVIVGGSFLQDIRVYKIGNCLRMAVGYVSGKAATEIGYEGFKVGDKVTWDAQMEDKQSAYNYKTNRHFTGTIDLLDSDKCYIKVDHSKLVAVKLYEDITLLNP